MVVLLLLLLLLLCAAHTLFCGRITVSRFMMVCTKFMVRKGPSDSNLLLLHDAAA
jgi:hypothetical protein